MTSAKSPYYMSGLLFHIQSSSKTEKPYLLLSYEKKKVLFDKYI